MSKKNRRNQPNVQGTKRNAYDDPKIVKHLEGYMKAFSDESGIGCNLCNHPIVDHDAYGCINCFPACHCDGKELIICIGNWKITLSETNIQAVLIEKRGTKNGNG